jgi:hypothetical protein
VQSSSAVAIPVLISAKVFGVVGLVLGFTSYRPVGGVLLALDGVLLGVTVALSVRAMRSAAIEEKTHKQILEQMVREGTLRQYLRDIRSAQTVQTS